MRRSALAESAGELLFERLDHVFERRAVVHLDENFRLHAGDETQLAEAPYELIVRKSDADRVEGGAGLLIRA